MENKKTFLILGSLQAPLTGSKIRSRSIAKYLAKRGHKVIYLEPTDPNSKENLKIKGVKIIKTKFPNLIFSLGMIIASIDNLLKVKKVKKVDYVIATKPLPSSCLAALKLRNKDTKIILDIDDLEYAYWLNNKPIAYLLKIFEKWVIKRFDYITVHNNSLRRYVEKSLKIPSEKILFLSQGLDLDHYTVRTKNNFKNKNQILIVYTAFLGIASDLIPILEVYKNAKKQFNNIKLIVVGGGPKLKEYKRYCKRNHVPVLFLGYKDHNETLKILKFADITLNYNKKNFANKFRSPIKLREYILLGKEVVTTDIGDTALFKRYIYISKNNLNDYLLCLKKAIKVKKNINGPDYIKKECDWDKIINKFLKDLNEK